MNNPKVSVIIVYTDEVNLRECVESILKQTFSNFEVICVNNGANDNAEDIIKELSETTNKIKLILLPDRLENDLAKRAGLAVAVGEFVIFIENKEQMPDDFIRNAYFESQENTKKLQLKNKYLYRRSFLENDREISTLIEDRYNMELAKYSEYADDIRQKLLLEFEKFNRNSVENLRNNTLDIIERFNALEKEFYHKEWSNQEKLKKLENSLKLEIDSQINMIQNEIKKIYDKHL